MKILLVYLALMSPISEYKFYLCNHRINLISSSICQKIHHDLIGFNPKVDVVEVGDEFVIFEDGSLLVIDCKQIGPSKYRIIESTVAFYLPYYERQKQNNKKELEGFVEISCTIFRDSQIHKYSTTTYALVESERDWLMTSIKYKLIEAFANNYLTYIENLKVPKKSHHVFVERIK